MSCGVAVSAGLGDWTPAMRSRASVLLRLGVPRAEIPHRVREETLPEPVELHADSEGDATRMRRARELARALHAEGRTYAEILRTLLTERLNGGAQWTIRNARVFALSRPAPVRHTGPRPIPPNSRERAWLRTQELLLADVALPEMTAAIAAEFPRRGGWSIDDVEDLVTSPPPPVRYRRCLSDAEVSEVRRLAHRISRKEICRRYGITRQYCAYIVMYHRRANFD